MWDILTKDNIESLINKWFIFLNDYYWVFIIIFIIWLTYKIFDKSSIKIWWKHQKAYRDAIMDSTVNEKKEEQN